MTNLKEIEKYTAKLNTLEEKLADTNDKLLFIAENMMDILWMVDANTRKFEYISPSVERILGYTPEEMLTLPQSLKARISYVDIDLKKTIEETIRCKSNDIMSVEVEIPHKVTKRDISLEFILRITYKNDLPYKIIGVSRDITERKLIEKKLRESEERFKRLADLTTDGIAICDTELKVEDANETFFHVLETPNKILGPIKGNHLEELGITRSGCEKIMKAIERDEKRKFTVEYCHPVNKELCKLLYVRTKGYIENSKKKIAIILVRDVSFDLNYDKRVERRK